MPPVGGLSSLKVQIPDTILRGQDAVFNCSYTLEDEKLYAVKWYRGTYEIFRYVPSDNPPTKAFPLQGYNVSVSLNNMRSDPATYNYNVKLDRLLMGQLNMSS